MQLSTIASFTAAAISLATLLVTTYFAARRERVKWAREELASAFYEFVDASYSTADAARELWDALRGGATDDDLRTARAELDQQHETLRHTLTKIRLLAPRRSLLKAQAVRQAHSNLRHTLSAEPTKSQFDGLLRAVADTRSDLIDSAKRAMSLPL